MALAQILDLDEARRRRAPKAQPSEALSMPSVAGMPSWCFVWMPMYFWYVG